MRTWLHAARDFAHAHGLPPRSVSVLQVFDRGGDAPFDRDFDALEATLHTARDHLVERIQSSLQTEVDSHQAGMFAERYAAVQRQLGQDDHPQARLLSAGLAQRVSQILDEGGRSRALRVRAAVDYFYSQAALHRHVGHLEHPPTLADRVAEAAWQAVDAGVEVARLQGLTTWGPQHICVLRCAPGAVRLDAIDAWHAWGPDQDLVDRVRTAGALAAVSGGFFLYSEPDLGGASARHDPVGLLVRGGQVRRPAVFGRAALLQRKDGRIEIAVVGPQAHRLRIGHQDWRQPQGLSTRAHAERASGAAIVGDRVVACGDDVSVPLNGLVLHGVEAEPGQLVTWDLPGVQAGLSGGPLLVRDGRVQIDLAAEDFRGSAPPQTFVGDETGDRNLLPRMAAGTTADGTLLFAAVDGRHFDTALGLGLHALGELMIALGATTAMNLDGGSSKRMVVGDQIMDLASTGVQAPGQPVAPPRPLHTALLIHARRDGTSR